MKQTVTEKVKNSVHTDCPNVTAHTTPHHSVFPAAATENEPGDQLFTNKFNHISFYSKKRSAQLPAR